MKVHQLAFLMCCIVYLVLRHVPYNMLCCVVLDNLVGFTRQNFEALHHFSHDVPER